MDVFWILTEWVIGRFKLKQILRQKAILNRSKSGLKTIHIDFKLLKKTAVALGRRPLFRSPFGCGVG